MILNVTGKPYHKFTAVQVLAARGRPVVCENISTIDDFDKLMELYRKDVVSVIVDPTPDNLVLNNDICNSVSCEVVTLDVEIDVDTGEHKFILYDSGEL